MKAIQKLNIGLALIILVLLLLNLETDESEYTPLTNLDSDAITGISLANPRGILKFSKTGNLWRLDRSPDKKINQETISKLLGILRTHSYRQFENTTENRKNLGLDNPEYQITLDDVSIPFGTTDPVQQLRYILFNNRIHLITDLYLQFLLASEDFFIRQEP